MVSSRSFKDTIYEQFARVAKAVASPKHIELLELIGQGDRSVESLAKLGDMTVANASQHLQVLRSARLVETRKEGVQVFYRLASPLVDAFMEGLRTVAESQIAEIETITRAFLSERKTLDAIDKKELLRRIKHDAVTVIDVRPIEEYQAGHLRHAISVPLEELEHRLSELPENREIVAYCRGAYCVLAIEAVERLRAKGFNAIRLEYGVAELKKKGFKIERDGNEKLSRKTKTTCEKTGELS